MHLLRDTATAPPRRARHPWVNFALAALIVAAIGLTGCGPVQSTQRISDAEVAFERARVVQAHEKAPYEYYSAKYYLHKAREEWGYSDFEASYDYARQAKQAADAAILKAKEDPWNDPLADKRQGQKDEQSSEGQEAAAPEEGPQGF